MADNEDTKSISPSCAFWWMVILVVVLWAATFLLFFAFTGAPNTGDAAAKRGQFGDMFGAANALFSGLAFAGVIYAILDQRADVKRQLSIMEKEIALRELEQEPFLRWRKLSLELMYSEPHYVYGIQNVGGLINDVAFTLPVGLEEVTGHDYRRRVQGELREREAVVAFFGKKGDAVLTSFEFKMSYRIRSGASRTKTFTVTNNELPKEVGLTAESATS